MTTTYRARASEQRVADEVDANRDLMCAAQGCPNRWCVDAGAGKLCSAHAWLPPRQWPQVTQEQLDRLAQRAYDAQNKQPPAVRVMSRAEKMQVLRDLRDVTAKPATGTSRDWAYRLVERHEAGEIISPLVLRMARWVANRKERA